MTQLTRRAVAVLACTAAVLWSQPDTAVAQTAGATKLRVFSGGQNQRPDLVRKLLADAPRYLAPEGLLAIEVGHNREIVEEAFPALSPTWLSAPSGDDKIFVLEAGQLL